MTAQRRPRIGLLAAPESSAGVLYGLYDVLISVGPTWPDMTALESSEPLLDVSIVAATAEPFRCFGNIPVEPHIALEDAGEFDAVVVCDMYTPVHAALRGRFVEEVAWLRRKRDEGALLATVCSGSLLLAETGLLDGRSCTGHWAYAELFGDEYPRIRFVPDAILDLSSEPEGLITAGGVTSWQDLALHLISRFCGPVAAAQTAKLYLLGGHEGGQLPFSAMSRRVRGDDRVILDCLAWIGDNFAESTPVTAMVSRSGLTSRTFARRFQATTGRRPIDHVHALRIEGARGLLEAGAASVDDVGYEVGYDDPTFFRRLFKRTTGLTPAAYRRKYASMIASG